MKKVISIDGGGIRGIVPAYLLKCIEEKLQDHLCNHVDLVAGTSTGAIVAAGVATGKSMGDIVDLYFKEGPNIFEKNLNTRLKSIFGLRGGKHSVENFIEILQKYYGTGTLNESLNIDFLSTAYSMTDGKPRFFNKQQEGELPLAEVIAASSAAPTYFDPVVLQGKEYIDGGVFAGNPAMAAYAEIKDMYNVRADEIFMLSLGTGNRCQENLSVKKWFKFNWVNPLIDLMMSADGGVVHHQLVKIYQSVDRSENYHRITGRVPTNIDSDMGNAKIDNMNNLLEFAKYLEKKYQHKLSEIAEKLKK